MVYVNNLTEASKAHLYNLHPLSDDTAFYESSTEVISFLQQYTYESDKMAHALSGLRNLSMKGLKLKTCRKVPLGIWFSAARAIGLRDFQLASAATYLRERTLCLPHL